MGKADHNGDTIIACRMRCLQIRTINYLHVISLLMYAKVFHVDSTILKHCTGIKYDKSKVMALIR